MVATLEDCGTPVPLLMIIRTSTDTGWFAFSGPPLKEKFTPMILIAPSSIGDKLSSNAFLMAALVAGSLTSVEETFSTVHFHR